MRIDIFKYQIQTLDWSNQLGEIQNQIQSLLDIHHKQSIDIIVEENKLRMFKADLVQYVRLGQYMYTDERDQPNNVQFSASTSLPRISNQSQMYKIENKKSSARADQILNQPILPNCQYV